MPCQRPTKCCYLPVRAWQSESICAGLKCCSHRVPFDYAFLHLVSIQRSCCVSSLPILEIFSVCEKICCTVCTYTLLIAMCISPCKYPLETMLQLTSKGSTTDVKWYTKDTHASESAVWNCFHYPHNSWERNEEKGLRWALKVVRNQFSSPSSASASPLVYGNEWSTLSIIVRWTLTTEIFQVLISGGTTDKAIR